MAPDGYEPSPTIALDTDTDTDSDVDVDTELDVATHDDDAHHRWNKKLCNCLHSLGDHFPGLSRVTTCSILNVADEDVTSLTQQVTEPVVEVESQPLGDHGDHHHDDHHVPEPDQSEVRVGMVGRGELTPKESEFLGKCLTESYFKVFDNNFGDVVYVNQEFGNMPKPHDDSLKAKEDDMMKLSEYEEPCDNFFMCSKSGL